MLKSIEVWDFESHEHTKVTDFSEGMNVIFGQSQAGKTSLIRALKMAAYNDWDPKSLRVGAKNCKVRVETHRGVVQVSKGEDGNLWEITPAGGKTLNLSGVGRAVVPQAAEIIGLSIVKLGDVDVPVNIMDQLEAHFMLEAIGNDKASGSVRAQIIDEISGLSGIEGVIKSVSLDNTRHGRSLKVDEKQMKEHASKLHDAKEMDVEAKVLKQAEEHLQNSQDALTAAETAEDILTESRTVKGQIRAFQTRLKEMPNLAVAQHHLDNADEALEVVDVAEEMQIQAKSVSTEWSRALAAQAALPDYAQAEIHLNKAKEAWDAKGTAEVLLAAVKKNGEDIRDKEQRLMEMGDSVKATAHLDKAAAVLEDLKLAEMTARLSGVAEKDITTLERQLADNSALLTIALTEQTDALKSVTVCPLNPTHPVSDDCLKGLRTPVVEET